MSSSLTCGILTVSDSCFAQEKPDTSGPQLAKLFQKTFPDSKICTDILPDNLQQIIDKLNKWVSDGCHVILTTGGTGFSPRDVTPEATRKVIEREAPGIVHAMMAKSLEITPMAMLSRAVSGIKDKTLIINFPGSAKAAAECFGFVKESIPHAVALIWNHKNLVEAHHKQIQHSGASKVVTTNVADRPRHSTYPLLEVPAAAALILQETKKLNEKELIPIEKSLHRVLAEDVRSHDAVPPFDASVKDGYAVRTADGYGPRVVKSALGAGDYPNSMVLRQGEAIRIGTGAGVPPGADAVVQVEDTTVLKKENGEEVEINIEVAPILGQDIRRSGCDVAKNTIVLTQGKRLDPAAIGVLAAVGKSTVTVYKRSSVGIFTTGNELKEHFEELGPGQIRDSNRLALVNILKQYHHECQDFGIVQDEPNTIKKAVEKALNNNDIVITTGGVSMGEFDFVKRVLVEDFNAIVHFGRVNMKPGKPTTFATLEYQGRRKMVFGLPGNPVSACVTCLLFVVPTLRYLEGELEWKLPTIPHVVSVSKPSSDDRPEYVRAIISYKDGKIVAKPNGGQISSRLNSLCGANGLVVYPGKMVPLKEYQSHIILLGDLKSE